MKKKLAIMAIAACVAAASVAGASQSVEAAPKLKLASEIEQEETVDGEASDEDETGTDEVTEEAAEDASDETDTSETAEDADAEEGNAAEDPSEEEESGETSDADVTEEEASEEEEDGTQEETDEEPGLEEATEGDADVTDEEAEYAEAADGEEEAEGEDDTIISEEEEETSSVGIAEGATISVTGTGSSAVTPDGAVLYVGVETSAESSKEAQSENSEKINAVIDALLEAGVEEKDITTSSFDIYTDYDYVDGSSVFAGYRVSTMLTVSNLDIDEVGDLIDLAVDAGANDVDGISYTYGDTEEAYDQALEAAIDRAYAKAELLAGKAGGTLEVVSIEEEEYSYSTIDTRSYSVTTMEAAEEESSAMTVLAGETEITATVNVVFRLVAEEEEPSPDELDADMQQPGEDGQHSGASQGHGPEARSEDLPQIEEEYEDTTGAEPQDESGDVNTDAEQSEDDADGESDEDAEDKETTDIEESAATKETDAEETSEEGEDGEE